MAQSDFETAISDLESGAGTTTELDQVTFYTEFNAALDVRIAAVTAGSPAALKMEAMKQRVTERQNEVGSSGAGLRVRP